MPAYQPARSRELEAAFLSPAWTIPLPESPGGVTDPGLPLRLHDACRRTRSALTSHPGLPRGHPRRSAAKTRCPPDQRQPGKPEPLSRSPPGFSPLGINARPKACSLGGLPSETPDRPSLPGGLFLNLTTGSSFRTRYVSFGSLFREPLGTISTMHQAASRVNRNRCEDGSFWQTIFVLFSAVYREWSVDSLCIKRECRKLFQPCDCAPFPLKPPPLPLSANLRPRYHEAVAPYSLGRLSKPSNLWSLS